MRTALLVSLLLASLYEVSAVENTSPFLAWSPLEFSTSRDLNAQVISVQDLKKGVFDLVDCSHKAILVVNEPELHANDLGQKGRDRLKAQVHGAGSSLQIPFVEGAVNLENLAQLLATKCDTPFTDANLEDDIADLLDRPRVIYKTLGFNTVAEKDHALDGLINVIRSKFHDNFLVLYSSDQTKNFSNKRRLVTRQLPNDPTAKRQSGLFHQYTFFSSGIFMGLLIVVIVVPVAFVGIFWNLSVQGPQRFEKKQN
ncbi:hypothetical protein B0O80DRAFT_440947 [Mortierella sp. GBAus27b]|nr:hypothetical protein BGX31_003604 [Mortierella sp. GBA43]KAI8359732.1 hypothetical protein B0O80DRAFT_440947 [Mortierella sp. GBAus27b]